MWSRKLYVLVVVAIVAAMCSVVCGEEAVPLQPASTPPTPTAINNNAGVSVPHVREATKKETEEHGTGGAALASEVSGCL
jgi:hypothetical protein